MSRSRAIDIRLERLVPAMEEYFIKGIFTKDELRDIAKQRTNHEYKLVARPLLYVDVRKAIDFELELESRVAKFLEGAETQIKNRTAIIERIVHIYDIAIPSICKGGVHTTRQQELERDALEMQYLTFLKQFNRTQELSKYLAAELQRAPSNVNAWVFSVDWELSKGNVDNARSIAQEALKHCSSTSPKVWTSLMTVETSFASSLARGILETDKTTTTGTKKNKNNKNNNEDSQQQEDADNEKPLSQRYFNTNAALAKIVVDGELIKGTCAAALDSQTGGIALLEDAEANLIKISSSSSPSNTSDMCGRFIAKYLFGACAQKQLDEQHRYEKEAESETQNDKNNNKNKISASLAVATKQQRSLNLTVSALAHLIQTPFNFFFSGSALGSSKRASSQHHLHHQYWSTSNYMDQTPDPCPLPQNNTNNKNTKSKKNTKRQNDDDNDEKNTDEYSTSERSIAAQTLQQLVAFSRSSTHPLVIKATLEFAEKIYNNNSKRLITKQQLGEILSGDVSTSTSKQQLTSGCAPACQQAFDECVTEFNRLNQQLQAAFNNNNKNNSNNKKSTSSFYDVSKELHINKWISEDFKDLLERSLNINIALSLAPKIFSTTTTTTDNTTAACDNNEDSASSTFSILDKRTRRYLASSSNDKTYNTATKNQLLADLNSWFNSTFGIMNKSNNKFSSSNTNNDLFGSEALSHQLTTMLLGRALLMMRMMSQTLPARRGRDDEDNDSSSSDDEDDDSNKKNNGGGAFAGFFDIIRLFNLCQPKTPSQIQVRAQAVTIVASVWVEAILLQQKSSSLTFPFIIRKDLQLPTTSSLTSLVISQLRTALTTCASVLPSSIDFLVHIAASIEYQLALAMNNNKNNNNNKMKTESTTKMRQYFEAAVSAAPKERITWSTWKKFETNLGNLKQAGEIQRRASQCLNDSRVL